MLFAKLIKKSWPILAVGTGLIVLGVIEFAWEIAVGAWPSGCYFVRYGKFQQFFVHQE